MAECIIARGGGRSDEGSSGPPIIADKHTILVTVKSSIGEVVNDLSVHCKDGDNWYNYHTNDKGQVLFVTNSGAANITAYNYSINGNWQILDQGLGTANIEAPVGLSTTKEITLPFINSQNFTSMGGSIGQTGSSLFSGNCKVIAANYANIFLGGAGGGGSASYWAKDSSDIYGSGGGGGGITIANGIDMNKNAMYKFYLGVGGSGSGYTGGSGATSSGFGYSATGGRGGSNRVGGREGTGTYGGGNGAGWGNNGTASKYGNWGGGGGSGFAGAHNGYSPYGGNGGEWFTNNSQGTWSHYSTGFPGYNGGGGGGGALESTSAGGRGYSGGKGGDGKISITFY